MTIQEMFVASNEALRNVVLQIKDEQWDLNMPEGTSRVPATLLEAVRYHTYDDAWVPDILAGKSTEEVGSNYDVLLESRNVREEYVLHCQKAIDAVSGFDDLDSTVHLSYGDYPAREYLQHVTVFRAFRSYDIAKLIGVDATMDPDLVDALSKELEPVIESYREIGIFGPALDVPDDADPQTKLLALVGRE